MKVIGFSHVDGIKLVCSCGCDAAITMARIDEDIPESQYEVWIEASYAKFPLCHRIKKAWRLLTGKNVLLEEVIMEKKEMIELLEELLK